jgi:Ca-activated chloride channel family protein
MANRCFLLLWCFWGAFCGFGSRAMAQDSGPKIHVVVDMVQLNVAVTDNKGNYVTGLRPQDFSITEDGVPERIATFGEGDAPTRIVTENVTPDSPTPLTPPTLPLSTSPVQDPSQHPSDEPETLASTLSGSNVFILFDTSNYMYHGFVFAQDAIANFVRSLQSVDRIAFYSYSRDLTRGARLTSDRSEVLRSVRSSVAGDDAALYNCLLLTVKDASQTRGRKVIVVFSNGPDNASMVPPEDVAELAQSTGTAIYMISTRQAKLEPISSTVFERMTAATGGKAYFAGSWKGETRAFASIRDDLAHLYSLSYYPRPNPNHGWRAITVKLVGNHLKKYHIRTRNGYRFQPPQFSSRSVPASLSKSVSE